MKQLSMYDQAQYDMHLANEQLVHAPAMTSTSQPTEYDAPADAEALDTRVTEIILSKQMTNNLQLVLPMLAHLNQDNRWLAWVNPPIQLLKQWQSKNGELSDDIMVLRSNQKLSAFELAKKALEAGTCHAVIVWSNGLTSSELRALDLASRKGKSHGIVLRYR